MAGKWLAPPTGAGGSSAASSSRSSNRIMLTLRVSAVHGKRIVKIETVFCDEEGAGFGWVFIVHLGDEQTTEVSSGSANLRQSNGSAPTIPGKTAAKRDRLGVRADNSLPPSQRPPSQQNQPDVNTLKKTYEDHGRALFAYWKRQPATEDVGPSLHRLAATYNLLSDRYIHRELGDHHSGIVYFWTLGPLGMLGFKGFIAQVFAMNGYMETTYPVPDTHFTAIDIARFSWYSWARSVGGRDPTGDNSPQLRSIKITVPPQDGVTRRLIQATRSRPDVGGNVTGTGVYTPEDRRNRYNWFWALAGSPAVGWVYELLASYKKSSKYCYA